MCKKPEPKETQGVAERFVAPTKPPAAIQPTHTKERNTDYDWLIFLGVLPFHLFTNVVPIYIIFAVRLLATHLMLSLHWQFVDKDNYNFKLTQKQLSREKADYMTAFLLHMYVQIPLQMIFPSMFFTPNSEVWGCAWETFLSHVFLVEPLYYVTHRWLHVPKIMKAMHGFHHLSIQTTPTTAVVQNFHEHFVYIATFGPAFFLPWLVGGRQHWVAIGMYLVGFDMVNEFGHTNLRIRNPLWTKTFLKYLFYTPEFHQGHHSYFSKNFALFMPMWDYMFGTAREYQKPPLKLLPEDQQDFCFIGHNGGLGHLLTIPEISIYNVYDEYKIYLPLKLDFLIMDVIGCVCRLFRNFYYCSRFCFSGEHIGRIVCLLRTPMDYMTPKRYNGVNREILQLMREQHEKYGTRKYGLGNLNKMKQLNDGGRDIVEMVKNDEYLKDKNIRVWTGDTMTVASVYHQVADLPDVDELFYIGAGGKVGTAVCQLLVKNNPNMKIRIFSRNQVQDHPNISYSTNLSEMADFKVVLVGKILSGKMYAKALLDEDKVATRFILDYTVPALPIACLEQRPEKIQHLRIGLLHTKQQNNPFLKGHYDTCMSHPENHIVPCHFGCLLNTELGYEENEVGDIELDRVETMWKLTLARGFQNTNVGYC